MAKVLLVDDDSQALGSTRKILELAGHQVTTASDGQAALELVRPSVRGANDREARFDIVISDVRMPRLGGLEFLRALSLCGDQVAGDKTPVILMTAFGRVEDAVWAMKLGAVDFITKPFKRQTLLSAVELVLKRVRQEGGTIERTSSRSDESSLIIGQSPSIRELRVVIARVAATAATVLVTGESGTGKELVARSIHEQSARSKGRFVAINCAAMPEQLIESELFGFEKGAFTGATAAKEGLFEAANGGTLLLDEVGDMPLQLQAKLLRVLQEGEVRRLGSTVSHKVDVRVIAATHRDLKEGIRVGAFRQDLMYRLEVIGLHVPPLRERLEDIPDLAWHFLKLTSARHDKVMSGISDEAMEILLSHSWPGNVRELCNVIERGVVFAKGPMIVSDDLPPHLIALLGVPIAPRPVQSGTIEVPLGASLKEVEELLIRKTLEATSGDKNMTAKLLGINSRTIYRKLDKKSP